MSKVALYIRLSAEDAFNKDESQSVTNQRMLLNEYLDQCSDLKTVHREEYIDDGYSGTNENRPAYQRMISDLKEGKVSTIIVKDLSRFMRDYIRLGDYLENIFPFLGTRFIAINDGYDSIKEKGNGTDLDVQFKALLYDFYAKDISEKIKNVTYSLKRQGKYMSGRTPMGYIKDPNDKYQIVVDETKAWIVRKVFSLALAGISTRKIAKIMNEEGISATGEKYSKEEIENGKSILSTNRTIWTQGRVSQILGNENYTGTYVFNMRETSPLDSSKVRYKPREQWERVFNHHEAIISIEDFKRVREILDKKKFFSGKNIDYDWRQKSALQGFARCSRCNRTLVFTREKKKNKERIYFHCDFCNYNGIPAKKKRVEVLEEKVLCAIKEKYKNISEEELIRNYDSNSLEEEISNLEIKKMNSFDGYKLGRISKTKFIEMKAKIDEEIENLKLELIKKKEEVEKLSISGDTLTRDLMEKYIVSVFCDNMDIVKIEWR
ncbi:MAG: recombinase family protein [Peptostreptococcaceae bacterium]|nr:recombinase family protein [Peptostreptococcaceae bacterium]